MEIKKVGNTIITYSEELHICRMAGCNSIIADLIDEVELKPHYLVQLCNQITKNKDISCWGNREAYINNLRKSVSKMPKVYDIYYKQFRPPINVNTLDWVIWYEELNMLIKGYEDSIIVYSIIFVILLMAITLHYFTF